MPRRTTRIVSVVSVSILASVLIPTVSLGETATASGCLSEPKGDTPAGSHWHYRVDHINKRNCWYLRREGEAAQAAPRATAPPAPSSQPAPPSVSDAHAEMRQKTTDSSPSIGSPTTTPAANSPWAPAAPSATATVATRWPDPATTASVAANPPDNQKRPPGVLPNAAAASPVMSDSFPPIPTGTLRTLLPAVLGALAFAGAAALILRRKRKLRLQRRPVRYARRPIWETTDDDRIVVPDLKPADYRDPRPRFARGAQGSTGGRLRATQTPTSAEVTPVISRVVAAIRARRS